METTDGKISNILRFFFDEEDENVSQATENVFNVDGIHSDIASLIPSQLF